MLITIVLIALCIGSFLNVCIYRIPRGQSIVAPRSACINCGRFLKWYHNFPVLSFLLLRGKCGFCKRSISWLYPVVELITAGFAYLSFVHFGLTQSFYIYFLLFVCPLITAAFIDLEHKILPDVITLPGIATGIGANLILAEGLYAFALFDSLLGVLIGGGFLFAVGFLYEKLRGIEGMGGGDVKLAAMLGAFLGWQKILFVLPIAALGGVFAALILMIFFKKGLRYQLPYGPFLALAGLVLLFYGDPIIRWYLSLIVP